MAVPSKITLYKLNDQLLQLLGLQDYATNAYMNTATVVATLKDRSGQVVAGLNALPLDYVAASDGDYSGVVPNTFNPAGGGGYTLFIDAEQAGATLHLEIPVEVKVRKS